MSRTATGYEKSKDTQCLDQNKFKTSDAKEFDYSDKENFTPVFKASAKLIGHSFHLNL